MKNKYLFEVKVLPRDVILDVQGRAVTKSLHDNGHLQLKNMRIGKYFEVEIEAETEEKAELDLKKMIDFVLVNPLIEKCQYERLSK